MPLHNVFSVGDLLIALGAGVAIHAACGTRLARFGRHVVRHDGPGEVTSDPTDAGSLVS
jgi:hypothetical protein